MSNLSEDYVAQLEARLEELKDAQETLLLDHLNQENDSLRAALRRIWRGPYEVRFELSEWGWDLVFRQVGEPGGEQP